MSKPARQSDTDKFEPITITLHTDEKVRADEKHEVITSMNGLVSDKVFRVKIMEGEEGRRDVANRCYQVVLGQVCKQMKERSQEHADSDPDVVAGKCKKSILLPLKQIMAAEYGDDDLLAEYEFESALCDMIAGSLAIDGHDIWRAYDRAIRSKTLKIKPFARYLDRLLDKLALQGFTIHLKPSERDKALANERSK